MLPSSLAAASHPINGSKTCLDTLAALTGAGTDKTSSPLSLSPPVAASSGLVVTDSRRSLGPDAKTGVDGLSFECLGRISDNATMNLLQGARHAVLGTLCTRAHRIGLDGTSCLLDGLRKYV